MFSTDRKDIITMDHQFEERRQCPCVHIVELAGKVEAETKLQIQAMSHCRESSEERIKNLVGDFADSNLAIKECLMSMKESALMFRDGNQRFKSIEDSKMALNKGIFSQNNGSIEPYNN